MFIFSENHPYAFEGVGWFSCILKHSFERNMLLFHEQLPSELLESVQEMFHLLPLTERRLTTNHSAASISSIFLTSTILSRFDKIRVVTVAILMPKPPPSTWCIHLTKEQKGKTSIRRSLNDQYLFMIGFVEKQRKMSWFEASEM